VEHLDVLVVGAGLSGIGAAHHLKTECPWATFAVFEARASIGGTWDLFKYPGLRSDSDMFTLGYRFRPWQGEKSIADGDSILQYIKDTAAEDGTDAKIRFQHRIVRAEWSTPEARWHVTAERTDTGEVVELTCGFLFACSGYYRYDHGYLPEFEGMDRFRGTIVHPQDWPEDLDYAGKRVVVIGSGATAVTLIPSMADTAAHVTMLQRSPTWIAPVPSKDPIANAMRRFLPERISGPAIRWMKALFTQSTYFLSHWRPELMKRILLRMAARQLPKGYDVATHFTPSYNPWAQRLCADADAGLFRAIREGRASVATDKIVRFTETGLLLESGRELEADVIVTATGLDLLFLGGIEITVDGEKVDPADRLTYKGMMLEGVPNAALAIGYANASWTLKAELTCEYVCRLLNHLRDTGLRQCTPVSGGDVETGGILFGLESGYLQRARHLLPKQGTAFPWQVHQSYLRDYRAMRLRGVEDEFMQFSNPVPAPAAASVG
jgi:cation diffusion facilitator CzcD-associated flavoprotein CzcO